METFASLGKMEAIQRLFEGTGYRPFEESPRFQCASDRSYITTCAKTFLEGIDFDLVYFPLKHLGYKCTLAVVSQLYAALSHPKTLKVCLGVSAKLDYEQIVELWSGVVSAAKYFGFVGLALDIEPSRNGLSISMSAVGETVELVQKRRSKAHSKDLICISGSVGAAYLGQALLNSEKKHFETGSVKTEMIEKYKMVVAAYLRPELSNGILEHLEDTGIYPSFGYSVDKGLADAVLRLCRDSGLGAKIYTEKLPFEGGSFDLGSELNIDPISAAMNGGDDYRVLFTIPITALETFRRDFQTFEIIGHLAQEDVGAVLLTRDGIEFPLKAQGWQ